jgi:cytochrome c oxidase cbb3-type subunit 2
VEIAPLFWLDSTIEKVDGVRPYTPLELAGRNIYHARRLLCLPQPDDPTVPRRSGTLWSLQPGRRKSMYDRPFQWGSKRTGPDLARVGGRYSDEWHRDHMQDPRAVVPESVMPAYPFLAEQELNAGDMTKDLGTLAALGVPYSKAAIDAANDDLKAQADPNADSDRAGEALPQGAGRATMTAIRPRSPNWMRSWPICRCWARWSTSRPLKRRSRRSELSGTPPLRRLAGGCCS